MYCVCVRRAHDSEPKSFSRYEGLGPAYLNYPPLGVEVQPPNAIESQVNTTCARHTKRNYKTRDIRHER